ncbi:hypothetical protein A45J_0984 [hot springs metagenome]|uniref:Uncharacterized protein n=1 Tax=hot springs metagenome TaxID=433727 RepID=A0A5J4KUH0_9ZZZZ
MQVLISYVMSPLQNISGFQISKTYKEGVIASKIAAHAAKDFGCNRER